MKIDKELLKGSTTMLILNLLENQSMYGYQMTKVLSDKSEKVFELKEGTLYPLLHALEEKGMVESFWEESASSRKRKYYAITKLGKKLLKEKREEWEVYSNSINKVLGGVNYAY